MEHYIGTITKNGFAIIPNVILNETMSLLTEQLAQIRSNRADSREDRRPYGVRDLFNVMPLARSLAQSPTLRSLIEPVLGRGARVVRGLFFNKTPEANWKVAWHQDLTIAVRERVEVAGYGAWSMKAGIVHVQPPASVLEQMLTLRIHLDDANELNGALRVIPGSHVTGRLSAERIRELKAERNEVGCSVARAGVLVMRPLLLHASSLAVNPEGRRVLHFEYSAARLPVELEWHEAVAV